MVIKMTTITVNKHKYQVEEIHSPSGGRICSGSIFYISKDFFIKETSMDSHFCGNPWKSINFYENYYKPEYPVPRLIEYQVKGDAIRLVHQRIKGENLASFVRDHDLDNLEGRYLLKLMVDALMSLESKKLHQGDVRLKNMMLDASKKKVYLIDFDHFGKKEDLLHYIAVFIYDFKHAYDSGRISSPVKVELPWDLKQYHSCCRDIVKSIMDGSASSLKDIAGLIKDSDFPSQIDL